MKTVFCIISALLLLNVGLTFAAPAAPPRTISYQGYLKDGTGAPLNGTVNMLLSLYDSYKGGTLLWTEKRDVLVTNGIYQIYLGEITPFKLTFDQPYWLGISVNGDTEMAPLQPLTSSPYALWAEKAQNADTASSLSLTCPDGQYLQYSVKTFNWGCSPGTPGPAGSGTRWRGPFDPLGAAYLAADVVQYNGSAWIAATNIPKECAILLLGGGCYRYGLNWVTPGIDGTWQLYSSGGVGPAGPQGVQGPQGATGPTGPQGAPGPRRGRKVRQDR